MPDESNDDGEPIATDGQDAAEVKQGAKKKVATKTAKVVKAKKPFKAAKGKAKGKKAAKVNDDDGEEKRTRTKRPCPAASFSQVTKLGEAIHKYAAGQSVRRLTLLEKLDMSPTSSATQNLITNSGKYGITKGSYVAEHLD